MAIVGEDECRSYIRTFMYLNCHTSLSFKYGTLSVAELFAEAVRCGVRKIALTEINNTASYIEMLRLCEESRSLNDKVSADALRYDLEIAVGVEFRHEHELLYVAIAKNNQGFEELNRFLSHHNASAKPFPRRAPRFDHVAIIYTFKSAEPETLLRTNLLELPCLRLTSSRSSKATMSSAASSSCYSR
jgi:DNA polymerase III alpha subunit